MAHVAYEHDGVRYEREYFASYPDNVIVMKVRSDKAGALSFTVRPVIPYLAPFGALQRTDSITRGYLSGRTVTRHSYNGRTGKITAQDNLITLRGETEYLHLIYEAQIKVIPFGGKMIARNDDNLDHGTISVQKADSAVILFTLGTNYQCRPETFLNKHSKKLGKPRSTQHRICNTSKRCRLKLRRIVEKTHCRLFPILPTCTTQFGSPISRYAHRPTYCCLQARNS